MSESGFLSNFIKGISRTKENKAIPDERLIDLFIKENNESAFDEIVNRYTDKIYRLALGITHDPNSAEEVLQEVFLTLIKKIDTFQGKSKFSTWLYTVAVNTGLEKLRSEKKHNSDISLENYAPYDESGSLMGRVKAKDWSSRPDIDIFSNEAVEMIKKAANELPEPNRVVFYLRDIEELSGKEVSKVLGISLGTVKSRLHRSRLFLRDRLSDYFYEWREQ